MTDEELMNLKIGDRVELEYGSFGTITGGPYSVSKMVEVKCDRPIWSCPYYYSNEIRKIIKLSTEIKILE